MPANLESGAQAASGDWRVAPMPQWTAGGRVSAENGGSALALPELGKNKALAYAFVEYANAGDGVQTRLEERRLPGDHRGSAVHARSRTPPSAYFGGQKANKVLAESAANVPDGWSYLPYQVYANSVFNDTVGKAYVSGTTLAEGLESWQEASSQVRARSRASPSRSSARPTGRTAMISTLHSRSHRGADGAPAPASPTAPTTTPSSGPGRCGRRTYG